MKDEKKIDKTCKIQFNAFRVGFNIHNRSFPRLDKLNIPVYNKQSGYMRVSQFAQCKRLERVENSNINVRTTYKSTLSENYNRGGDYEKGTT